MPDGGIAGARLVPLEGLFTAAQTLHAARTVDLPTAVVYMNAPRIGLEAFAREWMQDAFRPRRVTVDPIRLGRLPAGTMMLGGNSYWIAAGDELAAEQVNPLTADVAADLRALRALPFPVEDIDAPCVIVARFGEMTWGHWLAEILPRAVLVEHAWPGHFRYLVPDLAPPADGGRGYAHAVAESLAAYGIDDARLIRIRLDRHYRFTALHAVSGVWSAAMPNPDMLDVMRTRLPAAKPPAGAGPRLALFRRDAGTRTLHNAAEVAPVLAARGFTLLEPARVPFMEQVAAFRAAETIVGVMGSGFAGLMYAGEGVRAVGASPGAWRDAYFYPFLQLLDARYADLRGPVLWDGSGIERNAPFVLFPAHLDAALEALDRPLDVLAPGGMVHLAGTTVPRRLGEAVHRIDFAAGGNAAAHLGAGWSVQEAGHIWSVGADSTLRLPPVAAPGRHVLELRVLPLLAEPYVAARRLDLVVNGTAVGSFDVRRPTSLYCPIPPALIDGGGVIDITCRHKFCFSARQLGIIPDDRPIGLGYQEVTLWRLP